MLMPPDKVELLIADRTHGDWESYEVDSDLLTPADAWHVTLGLNKGKMPSGVAVGAQVEVRVGGETVMMGYVDEMAHRIDKTSHTYMLSGRDMASDLLDCSCPVFSMRQATLNQLIAAFSRDFGIKKHRIDAKPARTRKHVAVDPGDTAWDALCHAAEANGLWPWFDPDGTLVVGGPKYTEPEAATLIMRRDGKANNILSLEKSESMHERFSKITIYGQTPGTDLEQGQNALHDSATDSGVKRNRPKIVLDHEADSAAVCRDRARKLLADGRLKALTLSASVKGHRIVAPGQPGDGLLWKPGQRVRVISEPHEIEDTFFLMARKFTGGRGEGSRTLLTLKEDGVWLPDAHPHNRHRRGKNSVPGQILDIKAPS